MGKELIKKSIQEIEVKNEDKWSIKAQRISAANFGALQKLLCWMSLALCMLGNISCFSGLENNTSPLVFMSTKGCRASENFEISSENQFLPIYAYNFCDAGQVSIFRYFEAWLLLSSADLFQN